MRSCEVSPRTVSRILRGRLVGSAGTPAPLGGPSLVAMGAHGAR